MTEDFVDRDLSDNQYVDLQTKIGPVRAAMTLTVTQVE
jgi:hypothetical protein